MNTTKRIPIGVKLSPILEEIREALLIGPANFQNDPPEFTDQGFRAAIVIFIAAASDQMWALQEREKMPHLQRLDMAEKLGLEIRQMVRIYTGVNLVESAL